MAIDNGYHSRFLCYEGLLMIGTKLKQWFKNQKARRVVLREREEWREKAKRSGCPLL